MRLKTGLVSLFLLHIFLLDYAYSESELMPMSSGFGSGSGMMIAPPTCNTTTLKLDVSVFDSIVEKLSQLDCSMVEGSYDTVFKSSEVGLDLTEFDNAAVFGDYFSYSDNFQTFSLEVCNFDILMGDILCSDQLINVSVRISRHSDRLLPFGASFSENVVTNADDLSVGVFLSNPIPFWGSYYSSIYLSTNGVLSFGRPFSQYWPVEFPYGWSSVPVIAPYWNDMDFRNNVEGSGLYYTVYTDSGTKRDAAFLQEFSDRLNTYTEGGSGNFKPNWMISATWYRASPYYGRSNMDETLTFQILLGSDSVDTYAIFLYEEGGISWNRGSRQIVIGYDAKNYVNYLNVDDSDDFIVIDTLTGNTGSVGEWYFQLTDPDSDINSEQECFKWVAKQDKDVFEEYFEGLPSCPCTWFQARRDWRFWFGWRWGLSSGPNCATLIWSRRQSTTECCYDDSGALLVGGNSGGSYKLYHPLFSNREYITEDKQPPSDNCSGYDPSQISFTWGDPHFQTVDGLMYTFNGIGEYVLLQSQENSFRVQVRLELLDSSGTAFNATIISAVVVKQGTVQLVQVEENGEGLNIYVNGSAISLPAENDTSVFVTENTTYDSLTEFTMSEQNFSTTDYISLRYSDDDLIIATSSGASVMVSVSSSILHLAVEVDDNFINSTEGLLGNFNGDPSDDFFLPNGSVLSNSSSERELFEYGKLWHVDETSSLFEYFDGNTYEDYNTGWDTYSPTFRDEFGSSIPDDIDDVCEGDLQCVFDYAVTNNISIATATHATTMGNQETQSILTNSAPVISGMLEVYVIAGQTFTGIYSVSDEDGDTPTFELKAPQPENITLNVSEDGLTGSLVWNNPGSELPSSAIQILANDSIGAVTVRNISVILCACDNNGTCITTSPRYNSHGHYLQKCACPEFFSGDLCEIDERGCSDTSCPEFTLCEANSSVPAGFTCSACQEGYEIADDGKCEDINECNTTNPEYEHNCTHICNNTEGSYECLCMDGYELDVDGRNCTDINECYERTDDCEIDQMCINTEGGFECSCFPPASLSSDGVCTIQPCVGTTGCDHPSSCVVVDDDHEVCLCTGEGIHCVGNCSGDRETLENGTQSCDECGPNRYGYRCQGVCDCSVNGDCVPKSGCVCYEGYSGAHCETEINQVAPEFGDDTVAQLILSQNLPSGAVLTQFTATDGDVGAPGEVRFSLSHDQQLPMNVSSGNDIFSINNETGVLVLTEDLNVTRGLYTRFVLTVVATDLGENPLSSEVIVAVLLEDTPAPTPSFDEIVYRVKISENILGNSTVLNLTCNEPEDATGTSNLTTTLSASNDSSLFSLDGEYDDLMLVLLDSIDYESLTNITVPHYTLTVTCTNQYELVTSAGIEIEIVNENDNPFVFDNNTYNVVVPENVPRYYEVLNVSAFDPDIPDGMILYDAINPHNIFSIHRNGTIYVSNPSVNREEMNEYILHIEAKLFSSNEITNSTVNIFVADINEEPPLFDNELYISDNLTTANTVGDVALVVTAVDDDFEKNGSVVYSIEENSLFAINSSTGEIYINNTNVISLYGSYVLEVYATDEGTPPLNSTTRVDIYVAPIPDGILFRNLSSSINISEDRPRGYEIVRVVAEAIDRNNGTIIDAQTVGNVEYALQQTNDSAGFHIGRFTGDLILLNSLDFETQDSYELIITASLPKYTETVIESTSTIQVLVTDVNDNAPVFSPAFYAKVVEEFTEIGTSILTVHADDADSGVNMDITYRLADDESVPFSVDRVSGVVKVNGSLNTPLDHRFYVVAEDSGIVRQSSNAIVFISVVRSASVVPEFDRHRYVFNVTENTTLGSEIGFVLAQVNGNISIEEYTHLQYRLQAPDLDMMMDVSSLFHIDSNSGAFSVLAALDAERQDFYAVYVEVYNASDDLHVFDNATIEIYVEDVNDHAPEFKQSLYTDVITIAQPQNSVLFNVSADDGDKPSSVNSQIEYSLDRNIIGFNVNSITGEFFIVNSTLNVGDYHMTVVATDKGDDPMSGTALVFISVIPADPQGILFEESEYIFNVSEDADPETLVGTIVAVDHNGMVFGDGSNLRYNFSNSAIDLVCLHINEYSGDVRVSCTLDREREPTYTLVVFAEYESNLTGEVRMTVNVLDINDNYPIFTKDVYAIVVFTTHGNSSVVIQVNAEDDDASLNGLVYYTFSNGVIESDLFRIDNTTGDIFSLNEVIPAGDYRLVVIASDSNPTMPETSTAVVFICVIHQEPDGPLQIITTSFNVNENSPTGTVVGTVRLQAGGTDIVPENYDGNLEFSSGGDTFLIDRNSGILKVVGALDREMKSVYAVDVLARFTEYNISTSEVVMIYVGDLNDNSPLFNQLTFATIINDGYLDNQTVPTGDIIATDTDVGTNAELRFNLNEENAFGVRAIDSGEGKLRSEIIVRNASLLQPGRSYLFNIIAEDNGDVPQTSYATVHIEVRHALPDSISFPLDAYAFNYTEHSNINTHIGTVAIEQETPALDDLVYSVSGGSGVYKFHIDYETGEIFNLVSQDREENQEFSLNITAQLLNEQNQVELFSTTYVTITILDINDNIPIFNRSSYSTAVFMDDIRTDTPLIAVSAKDADSGSNALINYSIVGQNDDIFRINESGSIFATSTSLDLKTYAISVEAEDMGDIQLTGTAVVIIDVRHAVPESISFNQNLYQFTISEYSISGTVVGQVRLEPPLPTQFVQYRRFQSDSSDFVIVTQSGAVQSLRQFNYEDFPSNGATIDFVATCILDLLHEDPRVTLTATASVRVSITDENDNTPQFTNFPDSLAYRENVTQEEMIAHISATDDDTGTNADLTFEILNEPDGAALFRIDSSTGELFVKPGLDREQQPVHTISVLVRDHGNPQLSFQSDITLTLLDINDNIPVLITSEFSVNERVSPYVIQLHYRDSDEGEYARATYHLISPSDDRFSVNSESGEVTLTESLNYEVEQVVRFKVQLTDNPNDPSNSNTPQYTVTVNVIDKPDSVPVFDQSDGYSVVIDPSITAGNTLIRVTATDDDGDAITYIIETTFNFVDIDHNTGELFFTTTDILDPGSIYEIVVSATDDSEYLLSSSTTVTVRIDAESLRFEKEMYASEVSEDAAGGYSVVEIEVQLLAQSEDYEYDFTYAVIFPPGVHDPFKRQRSPYSIYIVVEDELDRETVPLYVLAVTATRTSDTIVVPGGMETRTVNLTITVLDVNDNEPVIRAPDPSYTVSEDASINTEVAQVSATDSDIGDNKDLVYSIIDPVEAPFKIDKNGIIMVRQNLDYEEMESYVLTVQVEDLGTPALTSTELYVVEILNINDETPAFAAPAYFSELYSEAPDNSAIHHVILEVNDGDGESEFTFSILPDTTDVVAADYTLRVSNEAPYVVIATRIPDNAESGLRTFKVEVSDGVHKNTTILYLGVFTQEHLLHVTLSGISKDDFLASAVRFLDIISVEFSNKLGQPVSYNYDSVEESSTDTTVLIITLYGWYGGYGTRRNNGEEETKQLSNPVNYITYENVEKETLDSAALAITSSFGVDFVIGDAPVSTTPTPDTAQPADHTTLVGIAGGTTVAVLLIVLLIVIIAVVGRRRKPKRDPYDLSYRGHRRGKREDSIPLTPKATSSDLAYETMYDDDEMLNQPQTMPWFDPNYLAPNDTEGYEGDVEQSSIKGGGQALRATVDGDAKRTRRHSSDESAGGGSVRELDASRYLGSYQKSTPMQPGQRMGEYDMFLKPNGRDSEKPHRPPLQNMMAVNSRGRPKAGMS